MAKTLTPEQAANKRRAQQGIEAYRQGIVATANASAVAEGRMPPSMGSMTRPQLHEALRIAAQIKVTPKPKKAKAK